MNKKFFLLLLLLITFLLPSKAVLKEDSLNNSLSVLRHELITYHYEQDEMLKNSKRMGEEVFSTMRDIMMRSGQNSLMLYSQKNDYVFDLTYACHEAIEQYQEFRRKTIPFKQYINKSNHEIARYDSLIDALSKMPVMMLNKRAKIDRNVCLTLATNIRRMLKDNNDAMKEYVTYYEMTERRLKNLNDYAEKRYQDIQFNIFQNGGENYFSILRELNWHFIQTRMTFAEKYTPQHMVKSQWDVRWIVWLFLAILIYGIVAIFLNFIFIRLILVRLIRRGAFQDNNKSLIAKRGCIVLAGSVVTFGLIMGLLKTGLIVNSNFVTMAADLLLEYSWLLAAILISLLLRVEGDKIISSFRVYAPLITVGFVVFAFRIVLIPSELVNIFFPPILLICALWQANVIKRHNKKVPKYDMYFTYLSLIVFILSTIIAWVGYTLLAVQILIWWIMMLTCILSLACVHDWMATYREKQHLREKPVNKAWFFRFLYFVVLPSLFVSAFIAAIYWSAGVFNLSDMTWELFTTKFVNTHNLKISIFAIAQVTILWFVFNYINHTLRDFIRLYLSKKDPTTAASRSVMFINVQQVVVWGAWLLIALTIFHVSNTWLVVVSGGLSTGIGFAMKDILENIYYGISLMAGRIKIGDYIICDGIRGKVSNISYTSTMLEAIDGSVITFQNSQLFTKNYKNMTKNHGYELDILEVGVAYGSNLQEVKRLLTEAISKLKCVYKKRPVKVLVKSFDDSCITLKVLAWVNVLTQSTDDGTIMECIYDTLNKNQVEIPFPQREITIKQITQPETNQQTTK